jgi:hypothetical protein
MAARNAALTATSTAPSLVKPGSSYRCRSICSTCGWAETQLKIRGEPAIVRNRRATSLYSVRSQDPDHEAIIRFSGKAPGRRVHTLGGIAAIAGFGLPPPRIPSGCQTARRNSETAPYEGGVDGQAAGRSAIPSGISPVVTMRHRAISSLRASATIIVVLRAPLGPSVRDRNHFASALSFWN